MSHHLLRILFTSPLTLALALTAPLAGCVDQDDERIDERTLEPAIGTRCLKTRHNDDGTRTEAQSLYYFDHINNQLAQDPDLRAHVGLDQVATCADAERFVLAERAYADANPSDERDLLVDDEAPPVEEHLAFRIYHGWATNKPGVVMVGADPVDPGLNCSGVFITPRHILSAAHCFDSGGVQKIRIREDDAYEAVRDGWVHIHPNFTDEDDVNDDTALISLWNDLPWTPTPHRFYTGTTFLGTQLQIYGYGVIDHLGTGAGTLRVGEGYTPINLNDHTGGYFEATAHTARICKGDSGGPAIDESISYPITWGTASHHVNDIFHLGDPCPEENRTMRWTKTNEKASWIAGKLLENLDGDFTCHHYSYPNSTGRTYYRCWQP